MLVNYKNLPFNSALRERARELRNNMTFAEVLLWKELYRKKFLGLNFDRQKIIGNYIVDFYCPDIGMVVEVDGSSHDCKEQYDAKRNKYFESLTLIVVHLSDKEIKQCMHWQLEVLHDAAVQRMKDLGMTTPESYASKLSSFPPLLGRGI